LRIKRKFDWQEILGDQAWLAKELADKLGMHIMTLRRYLRFAEHAGKLLVFRKGRYKFYVTKEAFERWKNKS